jgi:methionine aminotransferase
MIIINSPHNPTGTIFRKSDIEALEQIVKDRNIVVLSDEVYEHLIYDGEEHQSVLRYPHLFEQSMAVFSFGKTLSATGWKLGYIVGPDRLISEFKAIHQWNVFCVNSFLQFAIADYLGDPSHYEYLPGFFQEKRDLMNELFANLPIKPVKSQGTYFQLYDYSEVSHLDDGDFAIELIEKHGGASIPISPFYTTAPGDKVVRFCFAKKKETLEKAAEALSEL